MLLASVVKQRIATYLKTNPSAKADKIAKFAGVEKSLVSGYIKIMERDGILKKSTTMNAGTPVHTYEVKSNV